MNKKLLAGVFAALLLASGCSNKEDTPKNDTSKEETSQEETKEQGLPREKNQELIDQLLTEEGVKDANVYEVNDKVVAKIRLTEEATDETAATLAEKYTQELTTKYAGKKINTIITKGNEVVADINKDEQGEEVRQAGETSLSVQSLVDEGVITFKENPISRQLSLLLDSTKLTGDFEGKDASDLRLIVDNQIYSFSVNQFKPIQFEVANTNYTEDQLKAAQIQLK